MKIPKLLLTHAYKRAFSHRPFWNLPQCRAQSYVPDDKTSSTCPWAQHLSVYWRQTVSQRFHVKKNVLRTTSHREAYKEESA